MKHRFIKIFTVFFFCIIFILSTYPIKAADSKESLKDTSSQTQEEKDKDSIASIEAAADETEKEIDRLSSQLEKILDILVEKYNEIMPKLKKMGATLQEKFDEVFKKQEEEEKNEPQSNPRQFPLK